MGKELEFADVQATRFDYGIFPVSDLGCFTAVRLACRGSSEEDDRMKLTDAERQEFIALA
jgi:hypothetical protein